MTRVGVIARPDLNEAGGAIRELAGWLRARGVEVCLEQRTAALAGGGGPPGCVVESGRDVAALADALVVLGGDGTLLAASQLLGDRPVPVVGVNFGSLGFLTEVTLPELYPALEGLLAGNYRCEERRMLHAAVERDGTARAEGAVLNDVVVTKAAAAASPRSTGSERRPSACLGSACGVPSRSTSQGVSSSATGARRARSSARRGSRRSQPIRDRAASAAARFRSARSWTRPTSAWCAGLRSTPVRGP